MKTAPNDASFTRLSKTSFLYFDRTGLLDHFYVRSLLFKHNFSALRLENPKNSAKNIVQSTIQGVGMSLTEYIPAISLSIKPKAILNTSKIGNFLKYFV